MTTTEMRVHMDCAGCEKTVRKALQDMKGVDTIEIDMAMQKVTVTGIADQKKILKTIRRRTGRRAELWQLPYNPVLRNNNYTHHYNYHQQYCGGPATYFAAPPSSSSYNYYKHGYDNHDHQYAYYNYGHHGSSAIFGSSVGDAFSEESAHGCSIM